MTEKHVLVVTNTGDLHADIVVEKIASLGGRPFRIDLDEFPEKFTLALNAGPISRCASGAWRGDIVHRVSGAALSASAVGAAWLRKRASYSFPSALSKAEQGFAENEMDHLLLGWLNALDCFWMSHPSAVRRAGWKIEQLDRARRFGFTTPASLVTNRRDEVDAFRRAAGGDIIYKPLSSARLAGDGAPRDGDASYMLLTTLITEQNADALDAVAELPCLFQHYIPKRCELRVTVINDDVFAARIDSQADARTAVDYRDFTADIRYDVEVLPRAVEDQCRNYVRSYGLTFGAIDLIVTPDGDFVFLEINPAGQFLFVEELVPELQMTDALARCLTLAAQDSGA